MTLLGARLLGARMAPAHRATQTRWFDQRRKESLWREISVCPSGRGSFEESLEPHRQGGMESDHQADESAKKAQEETHMHKVNGIGKFLQLGSVVQGGERGPRWFALPGSWRAPRIQIMRKHDEAAPAVHDDRRTVRMLTPTTGQGGL